MALRRSPTLRTEIKQSGQNPTAGWVGKLLYSSNGYTSHSAKLALDRSLKALETEYIDIFLLHDPGGNISSHGHELADYLDSQISAGRIRSWGIANDTYEQSGPQPVVSQRGQVVQLRDDVFEHHPTAEEEWRTRRGSPSESWRDRFSECAAILIGRPKDEINFLERPVWSRPH